MMSKFFVVDENRTPGGPIHPGRACLLLKESKAAGLRRCPLTLLLKTMGAQPLRVRLDPDSKTSGIALVNDVTGEIVFAAELAHRGGATKEAMETQRAVRRSRRQRQMRGRKARLLHRCRKYQRVALQARPYLPPSLESRRANVVPWVKRLLRVAPITAISGVAYPQGELAADEIRASLLEKWNHTCMYCRALGVPLQVEHGRARANGGTNRVSNRACEACNPATGTLPIEVFLADRPEVLTSLQNQAKTPLSDAAVVNSMRWVLSRRLLLPGVPVEGGRTRWNRTRRGLPKLRWMDAACTGVRTPERLAYEPIVPLLITAQGHGCRRTYNGDGAGFPRGKAKGARRVRRVVVRASGSFHVTTTSGRVEGMSHRFCRPLHQYDGYSYGLEKRGAAPIQPMRSGHSSPA